MTSLPMNNEYVVSVPDSVVSQVAAQTQEQAADEAQTRIAGAASRAGSAKAAAQTRASGPKNSAESERETQAQVTNEAMGADSSVQDDNAYGATGDSAAAQARLQAEREIKEQLESGQINDELVKQAADQQMEQQAQRKKDKEARQQQDGTDISADEQHARQEENNRDMQQSYEEEMRHVDAQARQQAQWSSFGREQENELEDIENDEDIQDIDDDVDNYAHTQEDNEQRLHDDIDSTLRQAVEYKTQRDDEFRRMKEESDSLSDNGSYDEQARHEEQDIARNHVDDSELNTVDITDERLTRKQMQTLDQWNFENEIQDAKDELERFNGSQQVANDYVNQMVAMRDAEDLERNGLFSANPGAEDAIGSVSEHAVAKSVSKRGLEAVTGGIAAGPAGVMANAFGEMFNKLTKNTTEGLAAKSSKQRKSEKQADEQRSLMSTMQAKTQALEEEMSAGAAGTFLDKGPDLQLG